MLRSYYVMQEPIREIPQRELRNRVAEVLREVEGGRAIRVTVRGRPVADLVPTSDRRARRFVPRAAVERMLERQPPDPDLGRDIDNALGQRIDELE